MTSNNRWIGYLKDFGAKFLKNRFIRIDAMALRSPREGKDTRAQYEALSGQLRAHMGN